MEKNMERISDQRTPKQVHWLAPEGKRDVGKRKRRYMQKFCEFGTGEGLILDWKKKIELII